MQGPFKKYAREPRVQLTEETFRSGMYYTKAPLSEGYSNLLINYNFKDNGEILIPRSGLRATELAMLPKYIVSESPVYEYTEDMMLANGRNCRESDSKTYKQLIIGQPSNPIAGTKLVEGVAHVATIYDEGETYEEVGATPLALESVATREMHLDLLGNVSFQKPSQAQIHGIALTDLNYIARQVGTFGFNNSYYCFKQGENKGLVQTKLTERVANKACYKVEDIPAKELTPKEAVMWGYNMLSANPYDFTNLNSAGGIQFTGLLPYDSKGQLQMSPQINQTIVLRCHYRVLANAKYTIDWEWKEPGAATWSKIKSEERTFTDLSDLTAEFSSPVKNVMVKVSATGWVGDTKNTYVDQVLTVGFNFDKEVYGSTANIAPVTYDLTTASGMTYWSNRLVVYGIKEDSALLFMSEVNEPSYFPYPNNTEIFDEPIIHATPFLDDLLVFTASKLWLLVRSEDGLSWTKKLIQGNFDIKDWDVHLIQVVKNMVFFKSGNYYYMIVPKLNSMTRELVIAPISKLIENFLDNFKNNVDDLIYLTYSYRDDLQLVHYYNFLDFEDVHNVYVFKTTKGVYINVDLLYNTILRNWRIHLYESQHVLVPFKQDATKKGTLMKLSCIDQRWKTTAVNTGLLPAVQFFKFDDLHVADFYIPSGIKIYPAVDDLPEEIEDIAAKLKGLHFIYNYQVLDTGYRNHDSDYKKRYREFQLKFNNISQVELKFYTDFSIDGEERKSFHKYEVRHETDPSNPDYGLLYVEQIYVDPTILPSATILAETAEDDQLWRLDTSMFPELYLWKVRFPISGKGYSPRLRVVSRNEYRYELLNTAWIFRTLYSR